MLTSPARRRPLSALALLTLLVAFGWLLIGGFRVTYMISDEYLVYRQSAGTLAETITYQTRQDVHPPLWFSLFWGWRQLTGDSEFAGRYHALLFSLLTLALVYHLGRVWWRTPFVGLGAIILLTLNGLFFHYALEIRPYAFAMLLVTLSMLAFERWLRTEKWRWVIVQGVCTALMLYVHYFLALVILVQAACFTLVWARRGFKRTLLLRGLGMALLALALWSPLIPTFAYQVALIRQVTVEAGLERGAGGTSVTTEPTTPDAVLRLIALATNGQPGVYLLVLGLGLYAFFRRPAYGLALAWGLGVPAMAFVINLVFAVYTPRYIISFTIGLGLAMAAGLTALPRRLRWVGLAACGVIAWAGLPAALPQTTIPFRDIIGGVANAARPGDVILMAGATDRDDVLRWESSRRIPTLWENRTTDLEQAQSARRVWFFTADWFNSEVREQFEALEVTHPVRQVYGDCIRFWCFLAQLLEGPPLTEPVAWGDWLRYWGIDIDAVRVDGLDARLWWRLTAPVSASYSFSLRLLDMNGAMVAQADGPIYHYGATIDTLQMEPNRLYIDHRTLTWNTTLPSGEYHLALVIYDWQTGEPLLIEGGSDMLMLAPVTLP
jgi:4-amino-4-deoxy-L-arabinose transferase-like glycosyltransferase